jgi:hypothetical protein
VGAEHVQINASKVKEFAQRIPKELKQTPAWDRERHFCDDTERTVQWVFVLDALNFSFWPEQGQRRWTVHWNDETVKGYWALACSLNQAMKRGLPITDAAFLEQVKAQDLRDILDGTGAVPMIDDRVKVLNEIGAILRQCYEGSLVHLLEEAGGSVEEVVRLVVNNFPCFRDVADYKNDTVYFFKRAQILCADLWGALGGKGLGAFADLNHLTAFADYKLPQLLRALGILEYSPKLAHKIDSLDLVPALSIEEIEIRSATICAVENLIDNLTAIGIGMSSTAMDWWLWDISHEAGYEKLPHHRTRTIFY